MCYYFKFVTFVNDALFCIFEIFTLNCLTLSNGMFSLYFRMQEHNSFYRKKEISTHSYDKFEK